MKCMERPRLEPGDSADTAPVTTELVLGSEVFREYFNYATDLRLLRFKFGQ